MIQSLRTAHGAINQMVVNGMQLQRRYNEMRMSWRKHLMMSRMKSKINHHLVRNLTN